MTQTNRNWNAVTCFSFSSFIQSHRWISSKIIVFSDRKRYFTVKGRINCIMRGTCEIHHLCWKHQQQVWSRSSATETRDRSFLKPYYGPKSDRLLTEAVNEADCDPVSCHHAQIHDLLVERVCLTSVLVTSSTVFHSYTFSNSDAEAERRLCSVLSAVSDTKWHSCDTLPA